MTVNRVAWTEGLFLRPQHFQQEARHTAAAIRRSVEGLQICRWGFHRLAIDRDSLKVGLVKVQRAEGLMPDGTAFALPQDSDHVIALDLSEQERDCLLYLCLPLAGSGGREIDPSDKLETMAPYMTGELAVRDHSADAGEAQVIVARPRFRLMRATDALDGYQRLAVARVREVSSDRVIALDDGFIPPLLDCGQHPALGGFLSELSGMLRQRGEALAGRVSEAGRGSAEISDFLLLQLINRVEPVIHYLSGRHHLHPEALYQTLIALAGELATFTRPDRRPEAPPPYRHDALQDSFEPVKQALRTALSAEIESRAVQIPLEGPNRFGVRRGVIANKALLDEAMFVLAAGADLPTERLRQSLPNQTKIGAVEKISQLVNMALPGIGMTALPVAPRQIPFTPNMLYFELDTRSAAWADLKASGALAIHVTGEVPNLDMALWAIKR